MAELITAYEKILGFLEMGGDVLALILVLIFAMWLLIFERIVYFRVNFPRAASKALARWEARNERKSWEAHEIRQAMLADVSIGLDQSLDMIKSLVAVCPLFGLLGTVTGMIEVFDVMAIMGTGSARAMASGIAKATIPTMAGMVGALTGILAVILLERNAKMKKIHLEDQLTFDH